MTESSNINQTAKVASGVNVLLGLWLIAAPWVLAYSHPRAVWNDVVVGIILIVLAAFKALKPVRLVWLSWANLALGIWLFIAPFVLQYGQNVVSGVNRGLWNDLVVGIFVIVLSWTSANIVTRPASR